MGKFGRVGMWGCGVVEVEIWGDGRGWVGESVVGMEVELVVFDGRGEGVEEEIVWGGRVGMDGDGNV